MVVLPFPFADRLAEKKRPALIVSSPDLVDRHDVVWVVMITSADNAGWPDDIEITDLDQAGLSHASVIRPAKIATIDAERIIRVAGTVRAVECERARLAIRNILGFE